MVWRDRVRGLVLAAVPIVAMVPAQGATLYLCKAYSGGRFWSTTACGSQQATIERMASVPDGMPFEQQVQLAEQARAEAAQLAAPPPPPPSAGRGARSPSETTAQECKALEDSIQHWDSMARQPQTGAMQDWISARRRAARDRQFHLRCR